MLKGDLKKGRVRGYAVLRQRALYHTIWRRDFLFRENSSQHGVIAHVDIAGMSFRKGCILDPMWVFIALKKISIKLPPHPPIISISVFGSLPNSFTSSHLENSLM